MKRLFILGAISSLLVTMLSLSWAATNLNSSRSNIYRVIYDTQIVSPAQATALLAELDKIGPADEAMLKQWLPANFKKLGVQGDRIKKISIIGAAESTTVKSSKSNTSERRIDKASPILILLLADPADEAQARHIAVSDPGAEGDKTPPKK